MAFASSCFPAQRVDLTVLGNTDADAWPMLAELVRAIEDG